MKPTRWGHEAGLTWSRSKLRMKISCCSVASTLNESDVASKVCRRIFLPALFSSSLTFLLPIFWRNCKQGQLFFCFCLSDQKDRKWKSITGQLHSLLAIRPLFHTGCPRAQKWEVQWGRGCGPQYRPKAGSARFTSPAALSFLELVFLLVLVPYLIDPFQSKIVKDVISWSLLPSILFW